MTCCVFFILVLLADMLCTHCGANAFLFACRLTEDVLVPARSHAVLLLQLDWLTVGSNGLILDVALPPNATSSCFVAGDQFR